MSNGPGRSSGYPTRCESWWFRRWRVGWPFAEPDPQAGSASTSQGPQMPQVLGLVSVVVRDYDEALDFYVGVLGFDLIEDSPVPEEKKRWVVVRPPGARYGGILWPRAAEGDQTSHAGNQTAPRVFLFLYPDAFERDSGAYRPKGVVFVRPP